MSAPDPARILRLVTGTHADAALKLEEQIAQEASAPLRQALQGVMQQAIALWTAHFGSTEAAATEELLPGLLATVRNLLLAAPVPVPSSIQANVHKALVLGVQQASAQLRVKPPSPPTLSQAITKTIAKLPDTTSKTLTAVAGQLHPAYITSFGDLQAALQPASKAVSSVERTARWTANAALAQGAAHVASDQGASRLWIAERDACVHCLAYAGQIAGPSSDFPAGLTFGKKPLSTDPIPDPPLHPNCRCRIVPWKDSWVRSGELPMPEALKREARRSIVRGFSLESESQSVRVQAAAKLLAGGADLPKSVEAYGAAAVKRGYFKTRQVP
jgi:hypothetical protein